MWQVGLTLFTLKMEAPNNHGGSDSTAGSSDDRRYFVMTKEEVESIVIGTVGELITTIKENPTRKIEKEDIQIALQKSWPDIDWNNELALTTSTERSLQLKFLDEVSLTVLTGEELNGKDGAVIRLAIFDKMTGQLVASGPEASIKAEILILQANRNEDELNWSFEDFNKRVIRGRNKGKPYFSKDMYVSLERGMGILCDVKLGRGSTWVKDCLCRLGARVVDNFSGSMVKEAWTKSFMVRDRRIEYSKKKESLSLSDKICRVRNLWNGGKIDKCLQREKIYTVEDLLIRLLKDYDGLKTIVNLRGKRWEDMVKHARACPSGRRMYCYTNSPRKTSVVFNIHGENLRLYPKRQYDAAAQMSSQKNKDIAGDLFSSAIGHWEDVFEFDDESSLQRHLSSLVDQSDSTQEIDMECIIGSATGTDVAPIRHDLDLVSFPCSDSDPETMLSNAIFENSLNVEAGTEGTGFMLTEPFRNRNQDNEASTSTSSYLSVGKNTCSPDFMQPRSWMESLSFPSPATDSYFCDMDSVPPPLWNDNIQFSDIDFIPIPIHGAKWGWNVLIGVLRWRNSLRRIASRNSSYCY